jgi:GTP-binding protein
MQEGRGLVIAANKADIVNDNGVSATKYEQGVRDHCEQFINEFGDIQVVACTALSGQGIHRVLSAVINTHDAWSRRIDTWVLNKYGS